MFPRRVFPAEQFAPRFFPASLGIDPTPPAQTVDFKGGPPIPGAPWTAPTAGMGPTPPPTPPPPVPAIDFFRGGPPIPGAPWTAKAYDASLPTPEPDPPVSYFGTEIFIGPPIPGSPWMMQSPLTPPVTQPTNVTTPDSSEGRGKPHIERVPDAEQRLRRHTEKVADIFNSLIAQDILEQTGPASWTLTVGGSGTAGPPGPPGPPGESVDLNGLTGTFPQ